MKAEYTMEDKAVVVKTFKQVLSQPNSMNTKDPIMDAFKETISRLKSQYPTLKWHSVARWYISATRDVRGPLALEMRYRKRKVSC